MNHHRTGRAVSARRIAVQVLRTVYRWNDAAFAAAVVLMAVGQWAHTGPAWLLQASGNDLIVYAAAMYGAVRISDSVIITVGDAIDPDSRDGDIAECIAEDLRDLHRDIDQGADADDVLANLRRHNLVTALGDAVAALAARFDARGEQAQGQRLWSAVVQLRAADRDIAYPVETAQEAANGAVIGQQRSSDEHLHQ